MAEKYTRLMSPKFRVSFAHVFTPTAMTEGQTKKYSVVALVKEKEIKGEEKQKMEALKALAQETLKTAFGPKAVFGKGYRSPFKDGNDKDYDGYEDVTYFTLSSLQRPGLVDHNREDIINEEDFYSGCYARATVTCYSYDNTGNKGVAFGLQNLQKLDDGDPFTSRSSAQDDFSVDDLHAEANRLDKADADEFAGL